MRKFLGYYKRHLPVIAAIITLLWIRAQGELNLPDYTSRIVDIGISLGGIEATAPREMRLETLEFLTEYMEPWEEAAFRSAYPVDERGIALFYEGAYPDRVAAIEEKVVRALFRSEGGRWPPQNPAEESMALSFAQSFVRAEYEALGRDMSRYQRDYILRTGGSMLLVLLIITGCILAETFLASRMAAGVARSLRRDVFRKTVSFSNAEFDKFSTASLITRSTNDIQQLQMISFLFLRFVVFSPMLGAGAVMRVVGTDSGLTSTIVWALGATLLIVVVVFLLVTPKFKVIQKFIDRLNLASREFLSGIMVVRAFNREAKEEEKFDKANKDLRGLNIFVNRVFAFMNPLMALVMNGTALFIIWLGGGLINTGDLQIGVMFAFLQYSMMIIMSFMMMTMIATNLPRALVSINRVSEVLSADSSIKEPANPTPFKSDFAGIVEFRGVGFKYPGADEYVLKDINFTAKPGETTAFIGSTGSGKSTAVNLIPRFYDVSEGEVLVEGVDVRQVKTKDLRGKIGYIPQRALLFSGTIASNIKYGQAAGKKISDRDMAKAAELAQAEEFINEKPEKYNEHIAQAGANVSGGQKQRLSIARAIAKKPGIFIFDDSFSALDYKTDAALRRAIGDNLKQSTLLVVAQRIGTIKNANQILVLDQGIIVGKGTHSELLASCDVYKQIALSQLSPEELGFENEEPGEGVLAHE